MNENTAAKIPEETARTLIEAAANISGEPVSELTTEDAIRILKEDGFSIPQTKAETLVAILWANMSMKQASQIVTADPADLKNIFRSIIEEIAQQVQEHSEIIDETTQRQIIVSSPGYDTMIDPQCQNFSIEALESSIINAGGYKEIREMINNLFSEAITPANTAIRETARMIASFVNSDEYKAIKDGIQALSEYLRGKEEELSFLEHAGDYIQRLAPFLQGELEEAQKDPEFANCSLSDVITNGFDENGNPIKSKYRTLIERAEKDLEECEKIAGTIEKTEEVIRSIFPAYHTMPNNPMMNTLQQKKGAIQEVTEALPFDMLVSREDKRHKRKEITAYTMFSYEKTNNITFSSGKLSEYERQVSDAIISLWLEAQKKNIAHPVLTIDMIYRAMPGGGDKASPKQQEAITETIDKLRSIKVKIDATEELRARKIIGESETFELDDYYLSARHGRYKTQNGGKTVDAYRINMEPLIVTYCNKTSQYLTVPSRYLSIEKIKNGNISGERIAMTPDRQAMTGYLLRRIAVMEKDEEDAKERKRKYDWRRAKDNSLAEKSIDDFREQKRIILFDTLFKDVGLDIQSRDKAMDNRKFCFQVLDYQTIVNPKLKGYKKLSKGRTITGVEIML